MVKKTNKGETSDSTLKTNKMYKAAKIMVIVFLIFFATYTVLKIWLNSLGLQGNSCSENIKFSKQNDLFLFQYFVINDSITRKYKIKDEMIECWVECIWHTKSKHIFWNSIQITEGYQLLLERKNPIDSSIQLNTQRLLRDQYGGEPIVFGAMGSSEIISATDISDTIKVFIYSCPSSPPVLIDSFYMYRK